MNKQDIKIACLNKQKEVIHHFEKLINEHKSLSDIDENETKDADDLSHQDESTEMIMNLQEQLNRAIAEFETIESLPDSESQSIGLGAVVQTDMGIFYISIPGKITDQEKDIHCISTKAPFYASINGKKVGEEFIFNNEKHNIAAIY